MATAEKVDNLVEFLSFGCSHCYQAEPTVQKIVSTSSIRYVPIIVAQNPQQEAISGIYTACMLSGIGWQFRQAYFNAVFVEGYPDASPMTVKYVLSKLGVDPNKIIELAKNKVVTDKLQFDKQMIDRYRVSSTPTFVINGTTVLEGDSALNSLLQ